MNTTSRLARWFYTYPWILSPLFLGLAATQAYTFYLTGDTISVLSAALNTFVAVYIFIKYRDGFPRLAATVSDT